MLVVADSLEGGAEKPPNPQSWGSKIDRSPPELGDLGGGANTGRLIDSLVRIAPTG